MMKLLFSTLFAAALSAAIAPRAAAQNVLDRCSAPIADAETMAARVAECRAWVEQARAAEKANLGPAGPKTPAPVIPKSVPKPAPAPQASRAAPKAPTPAEIAAAAKARALPKLANPIPPIPPVVFISTVLIPMEIVKSLQAEPATIDRLGLYFAYEAFAAGDAGRCDPMKFVASALPCRETVDELNFTRARVGPRAAFIETCVKSPGAAGARLKPAQLPELCALIADYGRDTAALCPKLAPLYASAGIAPGLTPTAAQCRSYYSALAGDAAGCAAVAQEARADCKSDALFAKAFKAKDPALCAGSARCRVLMGEGRAVLKEMEPAFASASGKWMIKRTWDVKLRVAPQVLRQQTKRIPTPGDATVVAPVTPVAPVPTPGDATVKAPSPEPVKPPEAGKGFSTPAPAPFKGFVCADPVWSDPNRKAAAAAVKTANLCLNDVEAIAKPSPELSKGMDERLEKLARLTLKMNTAFEPGGPVKKAKTPAKRPVKQH
jgi:hypothetical protein